MSNKKNDVSNTNLSRRRVVKSLAIGASGISFAKLVPAQAQVDDSLPAITSLLLDDSCPLVTVEFLPLASDNRPQVVEVPEGVKRVDMIVRGAGGGSANGAEEASGAAGGNGGMVAIKDYLVNGGDTLTVQVGEGGKPDGTPGEFGGGAGGDSLSFVGGVSGAGGGGHAAVLLEGSEPIIMAGGGGGSGGGFSGSDVAGGFGGNATSDNEAGDGGNGQGASDAFGFFGNGGGGTPGAGASISGSAGTQGASLQGGAGGANLSESSSESGGGGGGGGGGFVGGSGGGSGGGFNDEGVQIPGGGGGGGGGGQHFLTEGATFVDDGGGTGGTAAAADSAGNVGANASVTVVFKGCAEPSLPAVSTGTVQIMENKVAIMDSRIAYDGGSDISARGVVFSQSSHPTLADTVVMAGSGVGDFDTLFTPLNDGASYFVRAFATNDVDTSYGNNVMFLNGFLCLVGGTRCTLADGSQVPIEDVSYDDQLLVWNFDTAEYDSAKPLWIKRAQSSSCYNLITFSDGSQLKTVGQHRILNIEQGLFTAANTDATPIGTSTYTATGERITVVSQELIFENVDFYNIITHRHINLFAEGVLTSCRLNNLYRIRDMRFAKDDRPIRSQQEFVGICDDFYHGLRLAEQPGSGADLTRYIERLYATQAPYGSMAFKSNVQKLSTTASAP